MTLDILYMRAGGSGWGPVDQLATLAARVLEGNLVTLQDRGEVSLTRKLIGQLPRRRARSGNLLVLASNPAHLAYAARLSHWLPGYQRTAAWVIDSFWSDRISRMARHRGHFDHVFITDRDLQTEWWEATGARIHWAAWGTDSLAFEVRNEDRPVDLLRIGRQPDAWSDDNRTRSVAESMGLAFEGRPLMSSDPVINQQHVRSALQRSKFVLAFSNFVSPASYTHPTREYLTGRWTDALGAGTAVAGVAPASSRYTLWPDAAIQISSDDLEIGMAQIRDAASTWTPSQATAHHRRACLDLDWRWRLRDIADALELGELPVLGEEISRLAAKRSDRA